MNRKHLSQLFLTSLGIQGGLLALAPLPFIFANIGVHQGGESLWRLIIAVVAFGACLLCAAMLFRQPIIGKLFGTLAVVGCLAAAMPYLAGDPFAALICSVATISAGFGLFAIKNVPAQLIQRIEADVHIERIRWAAVGVVLGVVLSMIIPQVPYYIVQWTIIGSGTITQILFSHWLWRHYAGKSAKLLRVMSFCLWALLMGSLSIGYTQSLALICSLLTLLLVPNDIQPLEQGIPWWQTLLDNPARILLSTFFALCAVGSLLLVIPSATTSKGIAFIDAAFTSVSAVCVTGLIVLDTPHAFTFLGQAFILLLIQLGGLGIMSITTVALHAMGRRISLKQERLMTNITDTDQNDLFSSLITVLKFTLIAEGIGSVILAVLFYLRGDAFSQALWRGLFTAISAFCNAGFALQSDSLAGYQTQPLILHTIALLIIFGGLAPAASLVVMRWIRRKPIPIAALIALTTTVVLLISGTIIFLAFEWNGMMIHMSITDKIHNAWFQSVTLRTAGFNSLDLSGSANPTFLFMICFMFIGGSPGGTAGGVKTTTIGILAMTFWSTITNHNEVLIHNRRINDATINRAVTITLSGVLIWFITVLMLEATQQINVHDLIFEATSALGTVGLSTGATPHLDEIGKVIVMLTMFIGRIGPITLFMLLSDDHLIPASSCPDARISLT